MLTKLAVTYTPAITDSMIEPLAEMVNANIAIIMPTALVIYMAIKGIQLIPRIISYFIH